MSRELFDHLNASGFLMHGESFHCEVVQDFLGLEIPATASKGVFERLALLELAAVDYVRNRILDQGMYLARTGERYRILSPTENKNQVEKYMRSSAKKLSRANKLSSNTPKTSSQTANTSGRLLMQQNTIEKADKSLV